MMTEQQPKPSNYLPNEQGKVGEVIDKHWASLSRSDAARTREIAIRVLRKVLKGK